MISSLHLFSWREDTAERGTFSVFSCQALISLWLCIQLAVQESLSAVSVKNVKGNEDIELFSKVLSDGTSFPHRDNEKALAKGKSSPWRTISSETQRCCSGSPTNSILMEVHCFAIPINFLVFFQFCLLADGRSVFLFLSRRRKGLRMHVQTFIARFKPKKKNDGEKQPTRRQCTFDLSLLKIIVARLSLRRRSLYTFVDQ